MIPAPGPPGTWPRAPVIVIRSILVSPVATASDWRAPVLRTELVTVPVAVWTASWSATGRD